MNTDGTSFILQLSTKGRVSDETIVYDKFNNCFCKHGLKGASRPLLNMETDSVPVDIGLTGDITFCSFDFNSRRNEFHAFFQYSDGKSEFWNISRQFLVWSREDGMSHIKEGIIVRKPNVSYRQAPSFSYLKQGFSLVSVFKSAVKIGIEEVFNFFRERLNNSVNTGETSIYGSFSDTYLYVFRARNNNIFVVNLSTGKILGKKYKFN